MTYILNAPRSDVLEHHGVKGMKWGVRNDKDSSGGSRAAKVSSSVKSAASDIHAHRAEVGKVVVKAIIGTAAGLGAATLAGPVAGAAVGTAVRAALGQVGTRSTSSDSSFTGGGVQLLGRSGDTYHVRDPSGRTMNVDKSVMEDMLRMGMLDN